METEKLEWKTDGKGLSNEFIQNVGKQLSPHFEKVLSCDKLIRYTPKCLTSKRTKKSCLAVNLAESKELQGHFILIIVDLRRQSRYHLRVFCSLKLWSLDGNVLRFIERLKQLLKAKTKMKNLRLWYSPRRLQPLSSFHCGFWILAFLCSQEKRPKESEEIFYAQFDYPPSVRNDNLVVDYLQSFIKDM